MRTKRIAYVLLALLIAGSSANAADLNSVADGAYSAGATWNTGTAPVAGDNVNVNHNVLYDAGATVPSWVALPTGGTLTLQKDLIGYSLFQVHGGTLDLAGHDVETHLGSTMGPNLYVLGASDTSVFTDSVGGGHFACGAAYATIDADLLLQAELIYHQTLRVFTGDELFVDADAGGIARPDDASSVVSFNGGTITLDHAGLNLGALTLQTGGDKVTQLNDKIASGELVILNQGYDISFDGTYTNVTAVPEPSALVVLGLGLVGLAARRRRQKRLSR